MQIKLKDLPDGFAFFQEGETTPSWKLALMQKYNDDVAALKALYQRIEELRSSDNLLP